jgi:O-antigen ligase
MNGIIERWTGVNFATYFGSKITYSFEASHTASPDDVTSTFLHRILFGTGMSVGMIMFFLFLDVPEFHQDRRKNWFFFFIVFAALYFSLSRGPWLSFAVALAVLMLIDGRIVITKIFGILMVLLMVVLIRPQVFDSIYGLFSATFDSTSIKGASYNWRFLVWKMAIERIIHSGNLFRIFFGFGRGSHIFMEFGRVTLSTGHVTQFLSWDSEFAILLYENGLTGVGVLIGLYVSFFRRSRRVYRMSKDKLMLVVLGIMIVLLFMKTNVSFFTPQLLYLEFICLAVSSYLIDRPSQALGDNDAFIAAK